VAEILDAVLRVVNLSAGELPHPWIITDESSTIDKRAGRWTNGGSGWPTRREALAALAAINEEGGGGEESDVGST
jgi:hypothetical protein